MPLQRKKKKRIQLLPTVLGCSLRPYEMASLLRRTKRAFDLNLTRSRSRSRSRFFPVRLPRWVWLLLLLALLESYLHWRRFLVARPAVPLDEPYQTQCREPDVDAPRASAVVVMMARNSEREAARRAVESFERHFNRWFQYPIVFLNDKPWDKSFIRALSRATSAETHFEVMSESDFGYPDWIDRDAARASMARQHELDWPHAGKEGYHHMCRFYSGYFYIFYSP